MVQIRMEKKTMEGKIPLKNPAAIMPGYSGCVANELMQTFVSMYMSGLFLSNFNRSIFHVHKAPLCVHTDSWSQRP